MSLESAELEEEWSFFQWAKKLQRTNIDFKEEDDTTLMELKEEYNNKVQGRVNLGFH